MKKKLYKFSKKRKSQLLFYVLGLILSKERKTCTNMASFLNISHDFLYRFLSRIDLLTVLFSRLTTSSINYFSKEKEGWIIIDDTIISKFFSKLISGVYDLYNSALGRPDRGFCIVVLVWTNGKVTIPIDFDWLFSKEIAQDKYKTKSEIAQSLLSRLNKEIQYKYFLADGHYSTKDKLLPFLQKIGIKFVMKIPCNRKITTQDGISSMIKKHPGLKLLRNSRSVKIKASFGNEIYFFSAHKRKKSNGEYEIVYLISNIDVKAKTYLAMYEKRWHIEVMFRTLKQSLGLCECQARDLDKQKAHIYSTFFSYNFLQNEKVKFDFKNTEEARRSLARLKLNAVAKRISVWGENFQCFA